MEISKRASDEEPKVLEPVLIKTDTNECIHINKNEFKIGRARDNDEIIMNFLISRKHCVLKCEGEDKWTIKDFSSNSTLVNNVVVGIGKVQNIYPGDIIQFSPCKEFKYVFTLIERGHYIKKQHINEEIKDKTKVMKDKYKELKRANADLNKYKRRIFKLELKLKVERKKNNHVEETQLRENSLNYARTMLISKAKKFKKLKEECKKQARQLLVMNEANHFILTELHRRRAKAISLEANIQLSRLKF